MRPAAGQLTFGLDARAPRLPGDLRPMLARPIDAPFDDPAWLFEPSWEGLRALAFIEGGRARLVDGRGRDLTGRFPDLLGVIDAVRAAPAVLDGEIVTPDPAGMPDPDALRRRLRPNEDVSGRRQPRRPASYLVNDILWHEGRSVLREPLERRRRLLATAVEATERTVVVPAVAGEGGTLFEAIEAQGLPAMLGRRADSPYLPGVRSDLWRLLRVARRFEAVIGGYAPRPDGSVALLLGAWERAAGEERFVAVGPAVAAAGSGLAGALERALRRLEDDVTPFQRGARADFRWVRPELVVTVEHRGWAERRLIDPQLVAIRDELEARACRVPDATAGEGPATAEGAAATRPVLALLQRLPLDEG